MLIQDFGCLGLSGRDVVVGDCLRQLTVCCRGFLYTGGLKNTVKLNEREKIHETMSQIGRRIGS